MKKFRVLRFLVCALSLPLLAQNVNTSSAAQKVNDINVSTGTTQIITAYTNQQIRIYRLDFTVTTGSTATTWSVVSGTGTNCGTNTTTLIGPFYTTTYSADWGGALRAPTSANVCISTTLAVGGAVSYR